MMDSSVAEELTRLSEAEMLHILEGLDPHEVAGMKRNWGFWGRTTQRAPEGGWRVWLMMAGPGFGRIRAGAERVRSIAESDGSERIVQVGATLHARGSGMVEGEGGLVAIAAQEERAVYRPAAVLLVWGVWGI